ncbi:MAG: hypothetical protein ACRDN6_12735 [Gaiellaceae bacterium]
MGLLDRLLGRSKKAGGDLINDPGLRREGARQEQEGLAEDSATRDAEKAAEERDLGAEHPVERDES